MKWKFMLSYLSFPSSYGDIISPYSIMLICTFVATYIKLIIVLVNAPYCRIRSSC
nr:MAG TPA: hypothetical protein [Caudoviricetes sp.]